jgi:hypothetical protein
MTQLESQQKKEPVVGWLGFIDALKRLNERAEQP